MFGWKFFTIVRQTEASVIERFGKFHRILDPGFNFLVPGLENIAYKHSLKEEAIAIERQQAITKDNVTIHLDGAVFIRVVNPHDASYKVEEPKKAVKLLCQTILRSEIGKLKLDQLMQERSSLNEALQQQLNKVASNWGLISMGVEILQIDPPEEIKKSMQQQAEAERLKRRDILYSEGKQTSEINIATGAKLASIKQAEGAAEAVAALAQSESTAIQMISEAIHNAKQTKVVDYILLSHYLRGYSQILKKSDVIVVPKGKGGQNNDYLNLAAMMMFKQGTATAERPSKSHSVTQANVKPADLENLSTEELDKLIKNNSFYDDIRLYSDEDDLKRK